MSFWRSLLICVVLAMPMYAAHAQSKELAPINPPPMGWSSWNSFSNTVNARIVMRQAKVLISSGLHRAGYDYVNIDEGWWLGKRDAHGNIVVNPKAWPALVPGEHAGDMANIVRYIHGLGLKAGIYTDAGADGCSSFYPDIGPEHLHTGSEGHYDQDFLQFAKWGFDYVKVDWCGGYKEHRNPAVQYAEIAHAIQRAEKLTGHKMYFSICEWGKNSPWTWAPHVGGIDADIWRTSGDIVAPIVADGPHANRKAGFAHMISNFEKGVHPGAEHTGFYNDPDMLVVGMPGMTEQKDRVHMALWAISGAPLIIGADLTKLDPSTLKILANSKMISIDQDPLGLQAVEVAQPAHGLEVWSKRLATPGERAVVLLNHTGKAANMAVHWSELGLAGSSPVQVTNVWTGKLLASSRNEYSTVVPANDAAFLIVHGKNEPMKHYAPVQQGKVHGREMLVSKNSPVEFSSVTSHHRWAAIAITYTNRSSSPRYAKLHVNGRVGTWIGFPPTGSHANMVWIQAQLGDRKTGSLVKFSAGCQSGPRIQSLAVQ